MGLISGCHWCIQAHSQKSHMAKVAIVQTTLPIAALSLSSIPVALDEKTAPFARAPSTRKPIEPVTSVVGNPMVSSFAFTSFCTCLERDGESSAETRKCALPRLGVTMRRAEESTPTNSSPKFFQRIFFLTRNRETFEGQLLKIQSPRQSNPRRRREGGGSFCYLFETTRFFLLVCAPCHLHRRRHHHDEIGSPQPSCR